MLFCLFFACKCVWPPGDNPVAVNKYTLSYTIVKPVHCHLVSHLNISCTQFCNMEDRILKLFLGKSRETAWKVSGIWCSSSQIVLGFDRDTSPFRPTTQKWITWHKSGIRGSHSLGPQRPVYRPVKWFLIHAQTESTKCVGALQCMKCVLRNFPIEKDQATRNCQA